MPLLEGRFCSPRLPNRIRSISLSIAEGESSWPKKPTGDRAKSLNSHDTFGNDWRPLPLEGLSVPITCASWEATNTESPSTQNQSLSALRFCVHSDCVPKERGCAFLFLPYTLIGVRHSDTITLRFGQGGR